MINESPTTSSDSRAANDMVMRRLAELRAMPAPIMPARVSRPAPRPRRHSVRHRSIR